MSTSTINATAATGTIRLLPEEIKMRNNIYTKLIEIFRSCIYYNRKIQLRKEIWIDIFFLLLHNQYFNLYSENPTDLNRQHFESSFAADIQSEYPQVKNSKLQQLINLLNLDAFRNEMQRRREFIGIIAKKLWLLNNSTSPSANLENWVCAEKLVEKFLNADLNSMEDARSIYRDFFPAAATASSTNSAGPVEKIISVHIINKDCISALLPPKSERLSVLDNASAALKRNVNKIYDIFTTDDTDDDIMRTNHQPNSSHAAMQPPPPVASFEYFDDIFLTSKSLYNQLRDQLKPTPGGSMTQPIIHDKLYSATFENDDEELEFDRNVPCILEKKIQIKI